MTIKKHFNIWLSAMIHRANIKAPIGLLFFEMGTIDGNAPEEEWLVKVSISDDIFEDFDDYEEFTSDNTNTRFCDEDPDVFFPISLSNQYTREERIMVLIEQYIQSKFNNQFVADETNIAFCFNEGDIYDVFEVSNIEERLTSATS